jgi:predicted nucleotidyltransferase component of viral defense system
MEYDIDLWVTEAPEDRKKFRQAVHTILHAISESDYLKPKMIIKGGMLIGIRYKSDRFTEDIDFSTSYKYQDIDIDEFSKELEDALLVAYDELEYGVRCSLQSLKVQPKNRIEEATFPSLKLKIGYANDSNAGAMKRLASGSSANTVKIDYSFNEITHKVDDLVVDDGTVQAYGFEDLIAEKLRSMHQQVIRDRSRRQDVYDLHYLLNNSSPPTEEEKLNILIFLFEKSVVRLPKGFIHQNSLNNEEIRERSRQDYHLLAQEIKGELPDFEEAFSLVNSFYESLPWDQYVSQ